jgi:hypothetical protein
MSYFCNYFADSFMTIILQKIENRCKREGSPRGEGSAPDVVCVSPNPIVFEVDGPKKE